MTWLVGRLADWRTARQMVANKTFYEHVRILRAAGIGVPERFRFDDRPSSTAQDPTQLVKRTWNLFPAR
jgi:hypothetical protein